MERTVSYSWHEAQSGFDTNSVLNPWNSSSSTANLNLSSCPSWFYFFFIFWHGFLFSVPNHGGIQNLYNESQYQSIHEPTASHSILGGNGIYSRSCNVAGSFCSFKDVAHLAALWCLAVNGVEMKLSFKWIISIRISHHKYLNISI